MVSQRLVLHVINSLGISGGAEQQLVTNLGRFADPTIRHHVVYLYGGDPGISWESGMRAPVTALNGSSESTPLLVSGRRLFSLVKSLKPDLIHCSLLDASLISRLVGRLTRTPVLESLVNISHEPIRTVDSNQVKLWKLRIYEWLDRLTMRKVTAFHALTDEVARSWVDVIGIDRDRITVIPRGVSIETIESEKLTPESRHRLRQELTGVADTVLVLAIGREEPQKGQRYLIDAFAMVIESEIEAHLVMAGRPGSSSPALDAQIAERGIGDRVHRLGVRTDIFRLMAAGDLMVFPSLYEGLGVSLIEGMGSGLPIVVFDRPPMNQIVEHDVTGLVVPDRDSDALARAISRLASERDTADRLGGQAARVVREKYEVGNTAHQLEGLYRTILDTHQDSSR
jgi:glycosyltransferase involved in cell wall biosynthesis